MEKRSKIFLALLFAAIICAAPRAARAWDDPSDVEVSTNPIGSPFFRHLAANMNVDIGELWKFEKKGFGRSEMITLIVVSKISGKPLKELGKRRLTDSVTLEQLAKEANLDYPTLYQVVRVIKEGIEAQGDSNLPPPVYEKALKGTVFDEKKKSSAKTEPSPSPSTSNASQSSPTPANIREKEHGSELE